MGSQAICILIDLKTALTNCNILIPAVQELSECETAQDISSIPVPEETGMVGFKRSVVFISDPVLRNAILMSNTKDPFKLIPLMTRTARDFDLAQTKNNTTLQGNVISHSDNLNTWLYNVKVGSINETRYSVTPDDIRVSMFCSNIGSSTMSLTTLIYVLP